MSEEHTVQQDVNADERLRREFFNGAISVYDGGTFHDDKTNTDIEYDAGIKLTFNKVPLRVSASWLAGLLHVLKEDDVVRDALKVRLDDEKTELSRVAF